MQEYRFETEEENVRAALFLQTSASFTKTQKETNLKDHKKNKVSNRLYLKYDSLSDIQLLGHDTILLENFQIESSSSKAWTFLSFITIGEN